MSQLRICIEARLDSGTLGGVEQVIIGLASGLSELTDGNEEYLFLTTAGADEWIRPYIKGPCRLLHGAGSTRLPHRWQWLKSIPGSRKIFQKIRYPSKVSSFSVPHSDGTIEKVNADIMHFTTQWGFITDVPSIYHPHDLQHLHLPQLFSSEEFTKREKVYRSLCTQAQMVAVTATWGKHDIVKQYGLPEHKVQVIPWAPVLDSYPHPTQDHLTATGAKFHLPNRFVFYPAQTYAHKNHLGLIESLVILREQYDLIVPLVVSGRCTDFYAQIERQVREKQLLNQVLFLGFVSPLELQCLYNLCRCVVIPSRFEAASFPLWEAFLREVPAACSNVTSLPAQAGDAALIFNPDNPEEMADAIFRLWTEEALRETLIARGKKNVARFSWDRVARTFRAHYRRIGGRSLTDEDHFLLAEPPLI